MNRIEVKYVKDQNRRLESFTEQLDTALNLGWECLDIDSANCTAILRRQVDDETRNMFNEIEVLNKKIQESEVRIEKFTSALREGRDLLRQEEHKLSTERFKTSEMEKKLKIQTQRAEDLDSKLTMLTEEYNKLKNKPTGLQKLFGSKRN